ncbi:MAG: hypothetical protein KatS3mg015_0465 [Fimbriimonadales bacterium]|nr:MAG: hypothetical protein KatS3mg015_0465 [Fimbriimonadales bacterium]
MRDAGIEQRSLQRIVADAGEVTALEWNQRRAGTFWEDLSLLDPELASVLRSLSVPSLYSHQYEALRHVAAGQDVVVTCGTDSGKTLCYLLPTIQALANEPSARALFLYPTKALAQDQLRKLQKALPRGLHAATYDGDTPTSARSKIRQRAHVLLTNPDMLHIGILPNHFAWAPFLRSLRILVLDELHSLQGVFGSHVALVLRRLLRLTSYYRSEPVIIATSATVGNPTQLFSALTGRQPILIDRDGAPKGERTLLVVNPPVNPRSGERLSQNYTSGLILARCVREGIRTLAFSQSRLAAELLLAYARQTLQEEGDLADAVDSYRAGYTPEERRQIERRLFAGELLGLSCTSAMELGVDVGDVQAVLLNGYPGSTNSLVQRAGRAGRGGKDSVAILVLGDSPLDQYYARHPHELIAAEPESVSVKPDNDTILKQHLLCAAWERPIEDRDTLFFPDAAPQAIEELLSQGALRPRATGLYPTSLDSPAATVSLRSIGHQYQVLFEGKTIATVEEWRALEAAYEGAIYLHRGEPFEVQKLDPDTFTIHVAPFEGDYYTRANIASTVETIRIIRERPAPPLQATLERIRVTRQTVGYEKRRLAGDMVLGRYDLDLPPRTWETEAVHLILDESLQRGMLEASWSLGVHALEHILLAFSPAIAECNRNDLGSSWQVSGDGHIYVYDSVPGGIGLAQMLYEHMERWIQVSLEALRVCPCSGGCPSCILSAQCWQLDEHRAKGPALALADRLTRPSTSACDDLA